MREPTQITPFDNTIELHLRRSGILPSKVHVREGKDRRGYIYLLLGNTETAFS